MTSAWPSLLESRNQNRNISDTKGRPLPLRGYSASEVPENLYDDGTSHIRRKSTYAVPGIQSINLRQPLSSRAKYRGTGRQGTLGQKSQLLVAVPEHQKDDLSALPTPPLSPSQEPASETEPSDMDDQITLFDFEKIDYELDRAQCMGIGLWSSVYFAQPEAKSPKTTISDVLTPSATPYRNTTLPPCSIFAVKVQSRPDAKHVFRHEARILTLLQRSQNAQKCIVPFYGLDIRTVSLVFEGVLGGSLESLSSRLKVMTELSSKKPKGGRLPTT